MVNHRSFWMAIAIILLSTVAMAQVGRIEGTVFLPGENGMGGPAANATVTIYREHHDSLMTTTNGDGNFVFENVPVAHYSVVATLDGYLPAQGMVEVTENRTSHVTLMLRQPETGVGNVLIFIYLPDRHGPAVGAVVTLRRLNHDSLTAVADTAGRCYFESVPVGEYSARGTLEGYLAAEAPVWVIDSRTSTVTMVLRSEPTGGGAVEGLVQMADASPAIGAQVELAGNHMFYRAETNREGHFSIQHVAAGPYTITAMLPMRGFASETIEVSNNQTTHVTLTLSDSSNGGGHHHGDSLTVVDLQGTAIVVRPDSINHPHAVHYYLDVDNDGEPDYRLAFGPPWYNPGNGATRPENGDQITIHGGLLTYSDPPTVVVYDINGQFWRRPFIGHGGHGGGDHGRQGCNPDSVTRVELAGSAMVMNRDGYHGEHTMYALNTDNDMMPNYMLDFGRPDYDPGNGATRPANGDQISIVGGQIYCPDPANMTPIVIVYEINGQFWRVPGDTTGLGLVDGLSADEPVRVGTPVSYLTAHNYPNPFNPTTVINYSLPVSGAVKLAVYDLTGRKVTDLVNRYQEAGNYAVSFDGHALPSGIYFYRVSVGSLSFTNRMVLLK